MSAAAAVLPASVQRSARLLATFFDNVANSSLRTSIDSGPAHADA
jgi:hypothetical protein